MPAIVVGGIISVMVTHVELPNIVSTGSFNLSSLAVHLFFTVTFQSHFVIC